jgi:hypothetical protein
MLVPTTKDSLQVQETVFPTRRGLTNETETPFPTSLF